METGTISETIFFDAMSKDVYEILMNEDKHSELTASNVVMSQEIDGKFEIFDGYVHGYNIELIEGEKIVQAWHFEEDGWQEDHFSICTFIFEAFENKCKVIFTQTGIPAHKVESLRSGWNEFYWEPMAEYLENN
ncbi:MAG: SRPBCC domain-containing protein [Bacteroidota bacterium]